MDNNINSNSNVSDKNTSPTIEICCLIFTTIFKTTSRAFQNSLIFYFWLNIDGDIAFYPFQELIFHSCTSKFFKFGVGHLPQDLEEIQRNCQVLIFKTLPCLEVYQRVWFDSLLSWSYMR